MVEFQKTRSQRHCKMPGGGGSSRHAELLSPGKAEVEKQWQVAAHLLLPVLQALHLEEQVEKVKQAVVEVKEEASDALAEVLVLWYFTSPLKSAVRKVIGNCMNSIKSTQMAEALTEQVTIKVILLCKEKEDDASMAVSRILGCFDNCKLGEAGVAAAGEQVPAFQDCYRILVSLKSWPGQLLSLYSLPEIKNPCNPCLR